MIFKRIVESRHVIGGLDWVALDPKGEYAVELDMVSLNEMDVFFAYGDLTRENE